MNESDGKRNIVQKSVIAALLAVVFLALIISIPSVFDDSKTAPVNGYGESGKTSISITYATGDETWNRAIAAVAQRFMEQHPEIEVILMNSSTEVQTSLYKDYIKRLVAADKLGDIVEIRDQGIFDGTDILTPLPARLTDPLRCHPDEDGNIYILPETNGTQGIIYNKFLFEVLDLEEPESYEDFLSICERAKKYKLNPLIMGAKDQWHLGFWMNHFFRTTVVSANADWEEDCSAGLVSWTDEKPSQMIDQLLYLFEQGYINSDYQVVSDSETALLIAEGKGAMLYSGPWMMAKIKELNPEISLGWFYLPDDEGNRYAFLDESSGWGITSACHLDEKKYEAAQLFLEFFYSDEILQEICNTTNSLPATKKELDLGQNEVLMEIQEKMDGGVRFVSDQIGDLHTPENFRGIMFQRFLELAAGNMDKDEFLAEMDAAWHSCLENEIVDGE